MAIGRNNQRHALVYKKNVTPATTVNDILSLSNGEIALFDKYRKPIPSGANLALPQYRILTVADATTDQFYGQIDRNTVTSYKGWKYAPLRSQISYLGYNPNTNEGDIPTNNCECCTLEIIGIPFPDALRETAQHCPCGTDTKIEKVTELVAQITAYNGYKTDYIADLTVVAEVVGTPVAVTPTATVKYNSNVIELSAALTAPLKKFLIVNGGVYQVLEGGEIGSKFVTVKPVYSDVDATGLTITTADASDFGKIGIKGVGKLTFSGLGKFPICNTRSFNIKLHCNCPCGTDAPFTTEQTAFNGQNTCCQLKHEDFLQLANEGFTEYLMMYPFYISGKGLLPGACEGCVGFDQVTLHFQTEEKDYISTNRWVHQISLYGDVTNTAGTGVAPNTNFKALVAQIDTWLSGLHDPQVASLT